MVKGLLHVAISVTDIRRTLEFYCDVLGFQHLFDINDEQGKPKTFYTLVKDDQYFEIFLSKPHFGAQYPTQPREGQYGFHHFTVYAHDLGELEGKLEKAGVEAVAESGRLWVRDPDENLIEFIQK